MSRVKLENVTLEYPVFDASSRSLKNTLIGSVGGSYSSRNQTVYINALTDINLDLRNGDRMALIGDNGAGKSTLLKVLAGVLHPQKGSIKIEGVRSSLTDVTMGMDLDSTGRENIILRAVFLGLKTSEAKKFTEDIANFTELGGYLDLPLRVYSTGMLLRLGFAVSTILRPEVLILDEMLSAGDQKFAAKSEERLKSYMENLEILILASHNPNILRQHCNKAIVMRSGRIVFEGNLEDGIHFHESSR